jgi:hypothetical protein
MIFLETLPTGANAWLLILFFAFIPLALFSLFLSFIIDLFIGRDSEFKNKVNSFKKNLYWLILFVASFLISTLCFFLFISS